MLVYGNSLTDSGHRGTGLLIHFIPGNRQLMEGGGQ
jgi:hypothetical protein